jgi:hypothetical protein
LSRGSTHINADVILGYLLAACFLGPFRATIVWNFDSSLI